MVEWLRHGPAKPGTRVRLPPWSFSWLELKVDELDGFHANA